MSIGDGHKRGCAWRNDPDVGICDCGLHDLLRTFAGEKAAAHKVAQRVNDALAGRCERCERLSRYLTEEFTEWAMAVEEHAALVAQHRDTQEALAFVQKIADRECLFGNDCGECIRCEAAAVLASVPARTPE